MGLLLSVENLRKVFGARVLFEALKFSIFEGERIGLIGPNGAGKSTLLKLLAGKEEPDNGQVVSRKGIRVAYLEQVPRFEASLSVWECLAQGFASEEEKASQILGLFRMLGLEASGKSLETPVGELSGGWRKRVALGRELARKPALLLLDEPTNHLDIEAILWLEQYLSRVPYAVITITHDRLFLQNVSSRILELDKRNPGGLLNVSGDYTQYLQRKEALIEEQLGRHASLTNRLRREKEWLERGPKARSTKQKARIERADQLSEEVIQLKGRLKSDKVRLDFVKTERQSKKLIEAEAISKSLAGRDLFTGFHLHLGPGVRLGLLGPNGCGKTTLIKVLVGDLRSDTGTVTRAPELQVAYFEQDRESLNPKDTVIKTLCPEGDQVQFQGKAIHIRSYLDRFLFNREQAQQRVELLSGGEQARLLIARLMLRKADILVLDEPTNDLDIATLDVLEECLAQFNGAVVLVSHDRYFLDRVSNIICAFVPDSSELQQFADIHQWEQWRSAKKKTEKFSKSESEERRRTKREKRKLSYNEERELTGMESHIHEIEVQLSKLRQEAELPENVSSASRLAELYEQIDSLQQNLNKLYDRWQELETLKAQFE